MSDIHNIFNDFLFIIDQLLFLYEQTNIRTHFPSHLYIDGLSKIQGLHLNLRTCIFKLNVIACQPIPWLTT